MTTGDADLRGLQVPPPQHPQHPQHPVGVHPPRERRFGVGLFAAALKLGPKLLAVFAKLAKTLKLGKVGLAAASLGGYALLTTWQFALVIVISISVHEYGHVWAMKRRGMKTRGFYLLPFIGGAAVPDSQYPDNGALAYVSIMGPIFGFALAGLAAGLHSITGSGFWAAAAGWIALINLFNLLPVNPLDGGRILHAMSASVHSRLGQVFLALSIVAAIGFAYFTHFKIFALLAVIGGIELLFDTRRRAPLPKMSGNQAVTAGACYGALVILLWMLMHAMQHEPGAALALEAMKH